MMARFATVIPLALLAMERAWPRSMERVTRMAAAYQASSAIPAIPVRLSRSGDELRLEKDGNHRLAAARAAGLPSVEVSIDGRDRDRLLALIARKQLA